MAAKKHEHSYKPTVSKALVFDGDKTTVVLKRCKCGAFDYERVPGVWSWEELTGKPAAVRSSSRSDKQFMREMGIRVGK